MLGVGAPARWPVFYRVGSRDGGGWRAGLGDRAGLQRGGEPPGAPLASHRRARRSGVRVHRGGRREYGRQRRDGPGLRARGPALQAREPLAQLRSSGGDLRRPHLCPGRVRRRDRRRSPGSARADPGDAARMGERGRGGLRRAHRAQGAEARARAGRRLLPAAGAAQRRPHAGRRGRLCRARPPCRGRDRRDRRAPSLRPGAPELGRLPSGRVPLRARATREGRAEIHAVEAPRPGPRRHRGVLGGPPPARRARRRRALGRVRRRRRGARRRARGGCPAPSRGRVASRVGAGRGGVPVRAPAFRRRPARRVRRPCSRGSPEPPDLRRGRRRRAGSEEGAARPRDARTTRRLAALAGCLLLAAVLAFYQLGARPLVSPAEARYALIAREMRAEGDWVQPRLNGVRYYEKPPLLYWSVAASHRLFGESEAASRLPSAAAYVATVAVTFFVAEALLGAPAAPLAALVFATAAGPFQYGRLLSTDSLFVLWLATSLLGLVLVARGRPGPLAPLLFWAGLSLAGLTKGFAGLVFPLGTAATWALLSRQTRLLRDLRPALGAALVALVLLPWHLLLGARDPDFLRFYIVNEHLLRFFYAREPIDYAPLSIGGFWLATVLWLLPWSLFLPAAVASPELRKELAIPLVWSAWVLAFFTFTASRLEYYALPAFPALAVVVAAYWRRAIDDRASPAGIRVPAWIALGVGVALLPWLVASRQHALEFLTWLITLLDGVYRQYLVVHPEAPSALIKACLRLVRPFTVLVVLLDRK